MKVDDDSRNVRNFLLSQGEMETNILFLWKFQNSFLFLLLFFSIMRTSGERV